MEGRRLMPVPRLAAPMLLVVVGVLALAWLMAPAAQASHNSLALVSIGPSGGNGGQSALLSGVPDSGTQVFFSTAESLTGSDTDTSIDVYGSTGAATNLMSVGPAGGAGAFPVNWSDTSASGDRVIFGTSESLTAADTDNYFDLYERSGGVTTLLSTGPSGGNGPYDAHYDGASADGSHVFFHTNEQLAAGDTDSALDIYERSGGTTTLVSTGPADTNGPGPADFGGNSADGSKVFFQTNAPLTADDTDSVEDVYQRSGGTTTLLSIGPTGGNSSTDRALYRGASGDGSKVFFQTSESLTASDGDTGDDVYQWSTGTLTLVSLSAVAGGGMDYLASSTDGSKVFYETKERAVASDVDAWMDIYQYSGGTTTLLTPGGNNLVAANADFRGASPDGSHVWFDTVEPLAANDLDRSQDVYEASGGNLTLISIGTSGGNADSDAQFDVATPDGSSIFFHTWESLVPADTDTSIDMYERTSSGVSLVSVGPNGGNGPFNVQYAGATPNASRVFFRTFESLDSADTDSAADVYSLSEGGQVKVVLDSQPDDAQDFQFSANWGLATGISGPPGNTFTLDDDANGTLSNNFTFTSVEPGMGYAVSETVPAGWQLSSSSCDNGSSPSSITVAPGETVTCTFTNAKRGRIIVVEDTLPNDAQDFSFTASGGLSPASFLLDDDSDGTLPNTITFNDVAAGSGYAVSQSSPTGSWVLQSASCNDGSPISNVSVSPGETVTCTFINSRSFARPKAASPTNVSLVPAYQTCGSPNRTHAAPWSFSSCYPPGQTSGTLTVGTPDANAKPANAYGNVKLKAINGNPNTPADEADVSVEFHEFDVRRTSDLSDYTGQLGLRLKLQTTDRNNGSTDAATGQDYTVTVPVQCVVTPLTSIGAACELTTTVDTLLPGAVPEGKRSIWALDQLDVIDGGADGLLATNDNSVYLRQGIFVP